MSRPLAFNEIFGKNLPYWMVEVRPFDGCKTYIFPVVVIGRDATKNEFICKNFSGIESRYLICEYGIKWRCWSMDKPTYEQAESTPWEYDDYKEADNG